MVTRHIVSVKAVLPVGQGFVLLKNERDEWELPGGQLEAGEDPAECVVREVKEELNLNATAERLLCTWQFQPIPDRHVLIIAYHCTLLGEISGLAISHEHKDVRIATVDELDRLPLPGGYATAIRQVAQ